jgi:hypothetical protein
VRDKGGLLLLHDTATQEIFHRYYKVITDYMHKHHQSWYLFALSKGLEIPPEDIILVRGFVKTSQWTVAAFVEAAAAQEICFQAQTGPAALSMSISLSNDTTTSPEYRTGITKSKRAAENGGSAQETDIVTMDEPLIKDQCVFISRYKIRYRKFPWKKIEAAGMNSGDDKRDEPEEDILNSLNYTVEDDSITMPVYAHYHSLI